MDALRSQGVIDVKHIQAKKDNKLQPTNTFILTFSTPTPPKSIKAAYMRIVVELYVPIILFDAISVRDLGTEKNHANGQLYVHSVEAGIIRKLIVMPTHTVPIVADITHVIQKTALSGLDIGLKRSQK